MRTFKLDETKYIRLDRGMCRACWKCLDTCPEGVIGKISILFHKHVLIDNPERCKGCQKCLKVCPEKAISPV
jgi:ferredoxin